MLPLRPHTKRLSARLLRWAFVIVVHFASTTLSPAYAQSLIFSSGGGPVSLTVNSAVAGSEPIDVSDNSTEITWDGDFGVPGKITVSTSCPSQAFQLYVLLTITSWGSGTLGTAQPEIQLTDGMLDTDIFRDIPTTAPGRQGVGTLTYRAAASVADGNSAENGDDLHTVTFTLLAQ